MSDDFLSQIHHFDRLEIPAVKVPDGARLDQTATQMGLEDPVEIPAQFGEGEPIAVGDRFQENVTGVFQSDTTDNEGFQDATDVLNEIAEARKARPAELRIVPKMLPPVINRPEGPMGKSFAPVRQPVQLDE